MKAKKLSTLIHELLLRGRHLRLMPLGIIRGETRPVGRAACT